MRSGIIDTAWMEAFYAILIGATNNMRRVLQKESFVRYAARVLARIEIINVVFVVGDGAGW